MGSIRSVESSNIIIRNINVSHTKEGLSDPFPPDVGVNFDHSNSILLENLLVENADASGIRIEFSQYVTIVDNTVRYNNHQGIDIDTVKYAWIMRNKSHNNGDGGIGISTYASRCYGAPTSDPYPGCLDTINCFSFPSGTIFVDDNDVWENITGIGSDGFSTLFITRNHAWNNYRNGIFLQHVNNFYVLANNLENNTCAGVGVAQSSNGDISGNNSSGHPHDYTEWATINVTWDVVADYTFECGIIPCYNGFPTKPPPAPAGTPAYTPAAYGVFEGCGECGTGWESSPMITPLPGTPEWNHTPLATLPPGVGIGTSPPTRTATPTP